MKKSLPAGLSNCPRILHRDFINTQNIPAGANVQLFDLNGRLLIQEKTTVQNEIIDITLLAEGLYLIRATKDNLRFHSKLVKN